MLTPIFLAIAALYCYVNYKHACLVERIEALEDKLNNS